MAKKDKTPEELAAEEAEKEAKRIEELLTTNFAFIDCHGVQGCQGIFSHQIIQGR